MCSVNLLTKHVLQLESAQEEHIWDKFPSEHIGSHYLSIVRVK